MRMFIVTKAPVDLDGACEIVGVFGSRMRAEDACCAAGTFLVAEVIPDRAYRSGTLTEVTRIVIGAKLNT